MKYKGFSIIAPWCYHFNSFINFCLISNHTRYQCLKKFSISQSDMIKINNISTLLDNKLLLSYI